MQDGRRGKVERGVRHLLSDEVGDGLGEDAVHVVLRQALELHTDRQTALGCQAERRRERRQWDATWMKAECVRDPVPVARRVGRRACTGGRPPRRRRG